MLKEFTKEDLKDGIEVLAFNTNWIDPDLNPKGFRIGFYLESENKFISSKWCNIHDTYEDSDEHFPEYWYPIINIRKFVTDLFHDIKHGDDEHVEWLACKIEQYYNKTLI